MRDVHGLPGLSPLVEGYTDLLDWLERHFTLRRRLPDEDPRTPANLIAFSYDWRLSCRYNAARLGERVAKELGRWRQTAPGRADAKVVFVCHSMGGLVARQYVEQGGGAELTRRMITLGTPYRGSLDALLYLVNGLRRGLGRLVGPALSSFARSLPSLHQLAPDYACLAGAPALRHAWEVTGLPGVDEDLLKDAQAFHSALRESAAGAAYAVEYLPVGGVLQPTPTTAEFDRGERLAPLFTIEGEDEGGDGRVPCLSSAHVAGIRRPACTPWEQHGSLQNNPAVRQALWGWLTPEPRVHRGPEQGQTPLGVRTPEVVVEAEPCEVRVSAARGMPGFDELAVGVRVDGGEGVRRLRNRGSGRYTGAVTGLTPGVHRLEIGGRHAPGATVTALVLVVGHGGDTDGE
ncbi:esterase/lipase family protein [Streptomyces sp. NPDC050164]|uniref:esterase/lipase family protein n=1 Tax=Streptomyces sp. NPDC050164 TaxID=3365605 RepID=UPI0037993437